MKRNTRLINALPHHLIALGINAMAADYRLDCSAAVDKKAVIDNLRQSSEGVIVALCPHLSGLKSIDEIAFLAQRFPDTLFLVIIEEPTHNIALRLAEYDNLSILPAMADRRDVENLFEALSAGRRYLHPSVMAVQHDVAVEGDLRRLLTTAKIEILRLISLGLSAKEIAGRRGSSVHTIVTHKKNLFRKLGVNTAYEAVRIAMRSGLADPIDYYI